MILKSLFGIMFLIQVYQTHPRDAFDLPESESGFEIRILFHRFI